MDAGGARTRVPKPAATGAARFAWTPEVHGLFEAGLREHGACNPALVTDHMRRAGVAVSREQVKSHLQKHRSDRNRQALVRRRETERVNAHLSDLVKAWNLDRLLAINTSLVNRMMSPPPQPPQPQQPQQPQQRS